MAMGRRRRVRELERRLAELDEWDARYGLGGAPPGHPMARDVTPWRYHSPDGATPINVHSRPVPVHGRHRQTRRRRRPVWPAALTVLGLAGAAVVAVEYPDEARSAGAWALHTGERILGTAVDPVVTQPQADTGVDLGPPRTGTGLTDTLVDIVDGGDPFGWRPASGERVLPSVHPASVGPYSFIATQPGGEQPVGFSPCGVVEVEVNPDRAPDGYQELVAGSLERLTQASGLQLQLVGETDATWWDRANDVGAPVLISWADAEEVPLLAGPTAGLGGAVVQSGPWGVWAAGGRVVVDVDHPMPRAHQAALLDHELAHVLGLDHVGDPGELMSASNTGQLAFGPGDLAGLAALGAIPCPTV